MLYTLLGRTGLRINKDGFGALPIQRATKEEAALILRKALDGGINYFDSARGYTDSEEKIGAAISDQRDKFFLATKTHARTGQELSRDLETSLKNAKTDYIDVYQFHNPDQVPRPDDGTGLYEAALQAKQQGKIRFIGITNHRLPIATEAVESGLFDTLQFPFSYLSSEKDEALVRLCAEKNIGFVAMKALSGGLITDIFAARAWMSGFANAVPIWGIQRELELDLLLAAMESDGVLSDEERVRIDADRRELSGNFCRGCGYCMPCPTGIEINTCARMSLLLRRSPPERYLMEDWQREMAKIDDCQHCDACKSACPYELDTPTLLAKNYEDYKQFLAAAR